MGLNLWRTRIRMGCNWYSERGSNQSNRKKEDEFKGPSSNPGATHQHKNKNKTCDLCLWPPNLKNFTQFFVVFKTFFCVQTSEINCFFSCWSEIFLSLQGFLVEGEGGGFFNTLSGVEFFLPTLLSWRALDPNIKMLPSQQPSKKKLLVLILGNKFECDGILEKCWKFLENGNFETMFI